MLLERKLIWIFKTIPGLVLTFSTYTMEDLDVSIGMTIECFQLVYCDMNFLQPDNDQKIRQWKHPWISDYHDDVDLATDQQRANWRKEPVSDREPLREHVIAMSMVPTQITLEDYWVP